MRLTIIAGLSLIVLHAVALAQDPSNPRPQKRAAADGWLQAMLTHMRSDDPRVRLSVREGLRVMGGRSIRAVKQAKAAEQNPAVKAFMDRTTTWLQLRLGKKRRGRQPFWDIDQVAGQVNLSWKQIDQVLPHLVRSYRERQAVRIAFKEAGGDKDPQAVADLREELIAIAGETNKLLAKILDAKQLARVKRYYDPRAQKKSQNRAQKKQRGNKRRER